MANIEEIFKYKIKKRLIKNARKYNTIRYGLRGI